MSRKLRHVLRKEVLPGSGAVMVAAPPASPSAIVLAAVGRVTGVFEVEPGWMTVVTCEIQRGFR
jgi:hypothetical protein